MNAPRKDLDSIWERLQETCGPLKDTQAGTRLVSGIFEGDEADELAETAGGESVDQGFACVA